jgi:long-chain fatty acid transport protein
MMTLNCRKSLRREWTPQSGWWLALVLAGSTAKVLANGFALPDQDAAATARGEAFVATADNPSAIFYNPAGITQLPGVNAKIGIFGPILDVSYKSPAGSTHDTSKVLHIVPEAYFTYTPESLPLSFGLGLYAPYGLGLEWPQDTGFRTIALKSEMSYLSVNPVIAWRIMTNLSIAAGPTFNWSKIELQQGVTPIPNNDLTDLKGEGVAYGFNLGLLWQPHPKVSLGLSYRSRTQMEYNGSTEVSFANPTPGFPLKMDATASLPFPQNIVGGISYRPTPKWNFEVDVDWTDWSQLKTINVQQAIPTSIPLNWNSSFYYAFGATRYLGRGWHVSGGYIYNENSVPDQTYNPLISDQNRNFFSAGFGYQGRHFDFDLAYQFGYGPSRTVTGSPLSVPFGQSADGEYTYWSQAFGATLGWRF